MWQIHISLSLSLSLSLYIYIEYIYPPTLSASSVLDILCHPASTHHQSKAALHRHITKARQQDS